MARRPVDEKIVKLSMDNKDLTRKAAESASVLSNLKKTLNKIPGVNFKGAADDLSEIGKSAREVNLDALTEGVDALSHRFSNLGIIGMTVLQDLTRRAMDAGRKMGRAIINPIIEGGKKRALNIEQAKFQFQGLGMDVEGSMDSALKAVSGTAFGLDEAAMAASQLGASGMDAGEEMTSALTAISGLAAMTGSDYSSIANIFTTVAGNGRLMSMQLLQFANRGINVAAALADELGVTEQAVREMTTEGKIDFETFYKAMDSAFGEHATKANETYAGSLGNVRAALSRIGASIATPYFESMRLIFVNLIPVIDAIADSLQPLIERFGELMSAGADLAVGFMNNLSFEGFGQGVMSLWNSFENILTAIWRIAKPLGQAMGLIFPPNMGGVLGSLIKGFERFTEKLIISETTSENLGKILGRFTGIIGRVTTSIFELAESFSKSFPTMSSVIRAFSLGTATALSSMGSWLSGLLSNSSFEGLRRIGETIRSLTIIFDHHYDKTSSVFKALYNVVKEYIRYLDISFESISDFVLSITKTIGNVLKPVGDLVKDIFSGLEFRHLLGGGFLVGVWGIVKKIIENMDGLSGIWKGIADFIDVMKNKSSDSKGFLTSISDSLTSFSDSLKEGVTIGRIVAIATSIGILAVSMSQLSKLDSGQIGAAMLAIASAMATLSVGIKALDGVKIQGVGSIQVVAFATAIAILTKAMNNVSGLDAGGVTKGIIAIATSMGVLVGAVKLMDNIKIGTGPVTLLAIAGTIKVLVDTLSDIDAVRVEGLIKGLGTIGILLAEIAIFARTMNYVQIPISTALSVAMIASSMHILTSAIYKMDRIRVEGLIKGLGTIGMLLGSIAVFAKVTRGTQLGPSQALGVLGISQAMVIMAKAIYDIDRIRVEGLIKGLGTIGILLGTISVFAKVTDPGGLAATAAGLTIMAVAIRLMVPPIKNLGNTRWQDLVKGLGALAGALAIMTVAATAATAGIGGAVALTVMSVAITAIVKPLKELGKIKWTTLLSSLGKLAVTIGVIAGASLLLSPAVVPILAFSAALAVFGGAVALIGGGLALFGVGLSALAGLTATTIAAIVASVEMLLDGAIGLIEKVGELALAIVVTMAEVISGSAETVAQAIVDVILAALTAIDNRLDEFITRGSSIVSSLLSGIRRELPEFLIELGLTVATVINGVAQAIDENHQPIVDASIRVLGAILKSMVYALQEILLIIFGWLPGFETLITTIGEDATHAIEDSFKLNEVVEEEFGVVKARTESLGEEFGVTLKETSEEAVRLFDRYLTMDEATRESFNEMYPEVIDAQGTFSAEAAKVALQGTEAFKRISWKPAANHAMDGLENQLAHRSRPGASLWQRVTHIGRGVLNTLNRALGNQSPSKYTKESGENLVEGMMIGLDNMTGKALSKASSLGSQVVEATNSMLDASVSELDTEVRVKVVMDTTDLDNFNPDSFKVYHPDTRFTNHMVESSQPRYNQNEDKMYREPKETNEYNYDVHIHATGALPRTTIRSMAEQFKDEIDLIDRRNRINRGEEVVY